MTDVKILEKIIATEVSTKSAHLRIDGFKEDLDEIKRDIKHIAAYMNRGKGWAAASLLISGMIGGVIVGVVEFITKK